MSLIACEDGSNQPWARQESPCSLKASWSYPFKFRSLTRAVEEIPSGSYQNKPQLHKILGIAEKFPLFHTLVDIGEKTFPRGQLPDLQQSMVTHHISGHCDCFRQEIKLLTKHPLSNLRGQYFHLACTKDISLNIHKAGTDQRKSYHGVVCAHSEGKIFSQLQHLHVLPAASLNQTLDGTLQQSCGQARNLACLVT